MQNYFKIIFLSLLSISVYGQNVIVNGYVFESGNRGYLNQVDIDIVNKSTGISVKTASTNKEGYFEVELPSNTEYIAYASKQLFAKKEQLLTTSGGDKKIFIKIQLDREPGYDFEVTLAPKRESEEIPVDAIRGAWIEVYNNTAKKEILNLKDHPNLEFKVHFDKGNHYTVMIRKDGFFTKRMEAYVNVDGCILCFEGVGNIRPGVVDNLTEGNDMGVLLANVELDPLFSGKSFAVDNIYYDLGKATLRQDAKGALINLALILNDNNHVDVELSSHTDSRGTTESNQVLSEARAKAAVDYLVKNCDVSPKAIIAAGYGESQLTNECADGVTCSEAEHQKNRRTEIRVLQVNNSKRKVQTLEQIRIEEEFMKSILEGDIETKVEPVEGEKSKKKDKNTQNENQDQSSIEELNKLNLANNEEEEKRKKEENDLLNYIKAEEDKTKLDYATGQTEANLSLEKSQDNQVQILEESSIEIETKKEKTVTEIQEIKNTETESKIRTTENVQSERIESKTYKQENSSTKGTVTGQRNVYSDFKKEQQLANKFGEYTGYKIVIQFSKDPISQDHEIFKRHNDISEYKTKSGTMLYMIGDYKDLNEAEDFLNKTVLLMYPGAYVVQFEKGKRLK